MKPQVSVIIPVRDDTVRLAKCLKALEKQTLSKDLFEVIVVDNNSRPPISESAVNSEKINIRLLKESINSSFAARNNGASNAFGDFLAFTDADTIPDSTWLNSGIESLRSNRYAAFSGGKVKIMLSKKPDAVECFEYFYGFDQVRYIKKHHFAVTANMFTTKEMFIKTGGFNSELKSGGDKEWGERAIKYGKGVYCKNAVVQHPARKNWDELKIKIERTLGGYVQINSNKNISKFRMLTEITGDMFPVKQVLDLFFIKRGPLFWKIKALRILIKLKWYRSFLKLKFLLTMKL
ncbi:MAG TPA: glycosyltransferase [bacterium]|nr:glycosyltransferase [bacterium]HPS29705.1 glycosyltransferase [bacterium]